MMMGILGSKMFLCHVKDFRDYFCRGALVWGFGSERIDTEDDIDFSAAGMDFGGRRYF
jgi:hypothetical protein